MRANLDERRALFTEKDGLTDPETIAQQQADLQTAEDTLEAADTHHDKLTAARSMLTSSEMAIEGHDARVTSLSDRITERDAARKDMVEASENATAFADQLSHAAKGLKGAQERDAEARKILAKARETLDAVSVLEANRQGLKRRKELASRLEESQGLTADAANASKAITDAPSKADMATLEDAWQAFNLVDRAHKASAAAITLHCGPGQQDRATLNGATLSDGVRTALPDGGDIVIDGFGTIYVHPAELGDAAELSTARAALDAALDAVGHDTLASARNAARQRDAEQENLDRYMAQLKIAAPDGIDALIAELATLPEHDKAAPDLPTRATAEADVERAETAHFSVLALMEGARVTHETLQSKSLVAQEKRDNAQSRLDRAMAAIGDHENAETELAQLQDAGPELKNRVSDAQKAVEDIARVAPNLDLAQAGAKRARGVVEQSRTRLHEIDTSLARLEAQIDHEADLAIEEKLVEVEGRLKTAEAHEESIAQELRVLQRLDTALAEAQADAHDAYIGPILSELHPLLRMVLPGAELKLDAESVLPTGLVRPEGEDSYDQLSGGTQEQIALLVRLAFARLLAKDGNPAPVILDDAIVYTDDDRIERMFNALNQQAGDLQIIVLSCRQKVFRGLGGQTLSIQQASQEVSA